MKLFRLVASAVAVVALVTLSLPQQTFAQVPPDPSQHDSPGQMKKKTNVHFMDLSLQPEMIDGATKISCLGDPDTLVVSRNDIVIFRAVGALVNHVRWGETINTGMANLSDDGSSATPSFEKGAAWAIKINEDIPRGRPAYTLDVKCGDLPDGPPVIIVDP